MENPEKRPNIVVVICHDLGQHLGCYGVPGVRSPNIDALSASGVRFARSFCAAPQCSPSRAALWTGRFPHANGVIGLTHGGFENDLNPDERHLAELLREHGYETHLFGLQHEARDPERCGHEFLHLDRRCGKIAADFVEFLSNREGGDRPVFAQIGFIEPHRPFPHDGVEAGPHGEQAVPEYLPDIASVREDLSEMEASVCSMDRGFGEIMRAIRSTPLEGDTLVVFTADHGIPFPRAKMSLYDPGIEVALILEMPGLPEGKVYADEMISNVDLFPTLLDFAGIGHPEGLHGRSFHALLTGGKYTPRERIFAEKTYHTYYDPMRAVRTGRWKLIANFENAPGQETSPDYDNNAKGYVEVARARDTAAGGLYHPPLELYDLESDPWEKRNLAEDPEHERMRDELARALRAWMEETGDALLDGPIPQGAYRERMRRFKRRAGRT